MGLETVTKISDLNPLWPLGTDPKSQGDDHIRNIKKALQATDGGAITGINRIVYTTNQTWTKPAGLKFLMIEVIGGGGGGGGAAATSATQVQAGAGGGGGGYAIGIIPTASIAGSAVVQVGSGGGSISGAGGGNGGTSSVGGTSAQATGGSGGATTVVTTGGAPGFVAGGAAGAGSGPLTQIGVTSEQGGVGIPNFAGNNWSICGSGGASGPYGAGQPYIFALNGGAASGRAYGGGGQGVGHGPSQSAVGGGAGAIGIVILTEFT